MLNLLVKSLVRRKILYLFVLNPNESFYPAQVAEEIKESPHAVGLELKYLAENKILSLSRKGSHALYCFNREYPFADILEKIIQKMSESNLKEIRDISNIEHKKHLEENLDRLLRDIVDNYNPEKIIVFGSYASGNVGPASDLDIVIIKKTKQSYWERISTLVDLLDYDVPVDLFVYTPEEFSSGTERKRFFQKEILEKGKVIYEKAA